MQEDFLNSQMLLKIVPNEKGMADNVTKIVSTKLFLNRKFISSRKTVFYGVEGSGDTKTMSFMYKHLGVNTASLNPKMKKWLDGIIQSNVVKALNNKRSSVTTSMKNVFLSMTRIKLLCSACAYDSAQR